MIGTQPSGLFDEDGTELLLVSFNIANTNSGKQSVMVVKDAGRETQSKHGNIWKSVKGTSVMLGPMGLIELWPGRQFEGQSLAPVGTDLCRVWLKYTGEVKRRTMKGSLRSAVMLLPLGVRSRLSGKFWRWIGFSDGLVPSSGWREIGLELPMLPNRRSGAHNGDSSADEERLQAGKELPNKAAAPRRLSAPRFGYAAFIGSRIRCKSPLPAVGRSFGE
jgi:hypothetical protein